MILWKWFLYTIFFALMPVLLKGAISLTVENCPQHLSFFDALDWIAFAFLLNITTINAVEISEIEPNIKTRILSTGIAVILFLTAFYFLKLMSDFEMLKDNMKLKPIVLGWAVGLLTFVSILTNFITFRSLKIN